MAYSFKTLICVCGVRHVDKDAPVLGLCAFCCDRVVTEARKRDLDLLSPPNPPPMDERTILGCSLWWWRGRWRIDRSKTAGVLT